MLIDDDEMYHLYCSSMWPCIFCGSKGMMHVYKNENSQFAYIQSATKPFVKVAFCGVLVHSLPAPINSQIGREKYLLRSIISFLTSL